MRPRVVLAVLLALPLFAALSPGTAVAQTQWHLGARVGYDRVWHRSSQDVRASEGDCGRFGDGSGNGLSAGVLGEVRLLPWLRGTLRLNYDQLGGTFRTTCDNGIIVPVGDGNDFAALVREYTKEVRLDYGLVELGVKMFPLEIPVFVSAGFSVGAPIFKASWSQQERIISPEGTLFPGDVVQRSNGSGEYGNAQLRSALLGGVGCVLGLHGGMELSPEILYSYPLSDAVTGQDWKISYLSAGVSVAWRLEREREAPEPEPEVPAPPPPPPAEPKASIGSATDASVAIMETFVTETFPILPYVFFGKNSGELPPKYRTMEAVQSASFTENALPRKTLDIYYHVLDIVGKRMHDDPAIRITLVGSTDDKDAEQGSTALALGRANAVRSYLAHVWKLDADRMAVATRALPQLPSSQAYPEGDEENRRVEIVSNSDAVFRPVVHERLSEFDITPPVMEIVLGGEAAAGFSSWSMSVRHGEEDIAQFGAAGAPPPSIRWELDDDVARRVGEKDSIAAVLKVTDKQGRSAESVLTIPVSRRQNSFEVGRLSLIVFDFDRSDILPHNQRMIRRFVAEAIKPSSSVIITGSTDRLGEADHNLELSAARAENVKALLLSQNPAYQHLETRGIGEAPDMYDNDLPEGRFYCRTVAVEVKTPVEVGK